MWVHNRMRIIASPQVQEIQSLKLNKSEIEVKWIDVFAVPNYEEHLRPFMVNISRVFKRSSNGVDYEALELIGHNIRSLLKLLRILCIFQWGQNNV